MMDNMCSVSKGGKEMGEIVRPFEFRQCFSILKATGGKAKGLRDLRHIIFEVNKESVFHHTYQYFLKGHAHEYTNDFAHWAGESLGERVLSEHLSNIDPYDFRSIDDLRNELLRVIDSYLELFPEPREAMPGDEFYFNQTITFVFPTGIRAQNLAEFLIAIKYVDASSIYYHFYEARTRLGGIIDDFSAWVENVFGKQDIAEQIKAIDPYMHTIEGIRGHIIEVVDKEVRRDMEVMA
jgi:septum formation topological specificity factor MinE